MGEQLESHWHPGIGYACKVLREIAIPPIMMYHLWSTIETIAPWPPGSPVQYPPETTHAESSTCLRAISRAHPPPPRPGYLGWPSAAASRRSAATTVIWLTRRSGYCC